MEYTANSIWHANTEATEQSARLREFQSFSPRSSVVAVDWANCEVSIQKGLLAVLLL